MEHSGFLPVLYRPVPLVRKNLFRNHIVAAIDPAITFGGGAKSSQSDGLSPQGPRTPTLPIAVKRWAFISQYGPGDAPFPLNE